MEKPTKFTGSAVALDMPNVDTDQIIPKQFLKLTERSGFGRYLFYNHRYDGVTGEPRPDFVLSRPAAKDATILVARENFGCGSSREHAVWALADFGFRFIIAPSFADIFKENCFRNGIAALEVDEDAADELIGRASANGGCSLTVDLDAGTISAGDGFSCSFRISPSHRQRLAEGLDEIDRTLKHEELIARYEREHAGPWQAAHSGPKGGIEDCG
jgi:3-isopropylmalate/(R)-2-methylmalate dehydratase small subunit